jgi:hypothetical protein
LADREAADVNFPCPAKQKTSSKGFLAIEKIAALHTADVRVKHHSSAEKRFETNSLQTIDICIFEVFLPSQLQHSLKRQTLFGIDY